MRNEKIKMQIAEVKIERAGRDLNFTFSIFILSIILNAEVADPILTFPSEGKGSDPLSS